MSAHALLGPSSAKRWLNCPGSARATENIPDDYSAYAEEGTLAHEIGEVYALKAVGAISPQSAGAKMKKLREEGWYTAEMEDYCKAYAQYCADLGGEYHFVEQSYDFGEYVPGGFGTADFSSIKGTHLDVVDLKYGKGVPVDAEGNPQLRYYGLGAYLALILLFPIETIRVHIYQPRLDSITTADYTVTELLEWAEAMKPQAQKAWDGVEEFKAGEWCRFCKMNGNCKTRVETEVHAAFDVVVSDPAQVADLSVNSMTDAEIIYWLERMKPIEKFLSDLKKYAEKQVILNGHQYEGWKVVEGRANRVYSDRVAVEATLRAANVEGYLKPKELLGITAMQKLLGKKQFEELLGEYLIKPMGKPALVPESDKRPAMESAKEAFTDGRLK